MTKIAHFLNFILTNDQNDHYVLLIQCGDKFPNACLVRNKRLPLHSDPNYHLCRLTNFIRGFLMRKAVFLISKKYVRRHFPSVRSVALTYIHGYNLGKVVKNSLLWVYIIIGECRNGIATIHKEKLLSAST